MDSLSSVYSMEAVEVAADSATDSAAVVGPTSGGDERSTNFSIPRSSGSPRYRKSIYTISWEGWRVSSIWSSSKCVILPVRGVGTPRK